jgi:hypothetical protein
MSDNNLVEYPKPPEFSRINDLELIKGVFCTHTKLTLSKADRNLTCKRCGAVLDVFDWLCEEVSKANNFFREKKSLEHDIQRKREQIEMLQAEEKRIKSRSRYLRNVVSIKGGDA